MLFVVVEALQSGVIVIVVTFGGAYSVLAYIAQQAVDVFGWVTFAPCFLWIFVGAPYIETLIGNRWRHTALSCITAAVVGVVLNLSIWVCYPCALRRGRSDYARRHPPAGAEAIENTHRCRVGGHSVEICRRMRMGGFV